MILNNVVVINDFAVVIKPGIQSCWWCLQKESTEETAVTEVVKGIRESFNATSMLLPWLELQPKHTRNLLWIRNRRFLQNETIFTFLLIKNVLRCSSSTEVVKPQRKKCFWLFNCLAFYLHFNCSQRSRLIAIRSTSIWRLGFDVCFTASKHMCFGREKRDGRLARSCSTVDRVVFRVRINTWQQFQEIQGSKESVSLTS